MARLLFRAMTAAGHEVFVASRFRTWEPAGDRHRQLRLRHIGARLALRVAQRIQRSPPASRPDAWMTYHLYHKAPDWTGPAVAQILHIPYIVVEASHAAKQRNGPWSLGYDAATEAIRGADCVIALNSDDLAGIHALRQQRVVHMKPFLELPAAPTCGSRRRLKEKLGRDHGIDADAPWLIAVAMMRERSKLESYRLLAKSLRRLLHMRWNLTLIGDGPARAGVAAAYADLPPERIHFAGELGRSGVTDWLTAADVFVWPAVNEAYGMAVLEAQACGLPVVAGRVGGVGDIVAQGETGLLVAQDAAGFAQAVGAMLTDHDLRKRMGARARRKVEREHDIAAAKTVLHRLLVETVARHRREHRPRPPRSQPLHG